MSTSNGLQTTQKIPAAGDSLESYDKVSDDSGWKIGRNSVL